LELKYKLTTYTFVLSKLSKYYIVIYKGTRQSARCIIIRIAVSIMTVAVEVHSRSAVLATLQIAEFTTTARFICVIFQTRALAGYHVAAIKGF
jgi:hypothetical protein